MKKQNKYYVVFSGRKKGIFSSWEECKASVEGFNNAKYKSFTSKQEAEEAYNNPYYNYFNNKTEKKSYIIPKQTNELLNNQLPIIDSLCVDAACSGNPGIMEYRGVHILTGKQIFYYKHCHGTNNIGEFLALVHGLSYLKRHNLPQPIYSDSINAIKWVQQKQCKTKLPLNKTTADLFDYINRAELWLKNNRYSTKILKWNTESWGEIPADFGRKNK